ncbi:hypothetical protein [Klebsiella pneumoniae]|jgi:hypothetical protein|uniref:hypothetical protein n=1 Tax=Klebsiella pneumoniae TaxID=573 RepID=UPI003751D0F7
MTTDIELAQSLKRRATSANEFGESLYVKADDVLALVEALASEKRICATWRKTAEANSENLEKAQQRIAELESRTVKLPQRLQPGADGYDDWYVHSDDDGEYLKVDDVLAMLTAAGIKVEAE